MTGSVFAASSPAAGAAMMSYAATSQAVATSPLPSDSDILRQASVAPLGDLSRLSGFFKKPQIERRGLVAQQVGSNLQSLDKVFEDSLSAEGADLMVENCLGVCGLPLGVVPVFMLNGKHYMVPMCVEEPSVIAAASSASKLISEAGGFQGVSTPNIMIGQLQVVDFANMSAVAEAARLIMERKNELIAHANLHCPSMVKRGGGVRDISVRTLPGKTWIVVHVHIDVCEAMGANIVNTVVEGVGPVVAEITGGRVGLKILSNLCLGRRTKVCFKIPLEQMSWKGVKGRVVAERILEAFEFAEIDPFRATTNNKGIMNGIDSVAIATGQDWRAIEAAAHAYASISGRYTSLSRYYIDETLNAFVGSMEIPISVGTKGGALESHPTFKFSHDLLCHPSAQELSQIIVGIGLAQNFAAMRALAIEGIQKGHMALHARNIAISAGCPIELVPAVVSYMQSKKSISKSTAEEYLHSLNKL